MEFREAHQQNLTEMEELRKFQSSTFDTIARRTLVEDQNTILELSGRIQELQNEVNCMNDSEDFQDAESVRSGNSHVTSRPVSFSPHPIPEGMLRHSFYGAKPQRRAAKHLGHTWDIGKRFCKPTCIFISSLSSRIASMEFIVRGAASYVYSGEKWKARTKSGSEMPVWTVSQRFSHLQWRRLFEKLWCRPTTTGDFRSSLWQVPYTSNLCLLEDKVQDRSMYLFAIPYGSDAMDQRSGDGWISGWIKIFVIYTWYFNAEFWSTWREDCFSAERNHPQFSLQKKNQSGGTKGPEAGPFLSWKSDRLPDLRELPGHWSQWFCRELCRPTHITVVLRNDDIQEFDSTWDGILQSMTKIPPDEILEGLYKLRIRESENSRLYWNCMTWRFIRRS